MRTSVANPSWPKLLYAALAVLGLAGTWAQGLGYLDLGFAGGTVQFWKDVFSTPSSIFLSVDILALAVAAAAYSLASGA